jgi:hypothetical protein
MEDAVPLLSDPQATYGLSDHSAVELPRYPHTLAIYESCCTCGFVLHRQHDLSSLELRMWQPHAVGIKQTRMILQNAT